jgi:hypothetical protein
MLLGKYRNQLLHLCVFHYSDIHDTFPLLYLKFYLELEPVFYIFRIFLFIEQIVFNQNQLFPENFIVYYIYTTRILSQ